MFEQKPAITTVTAESLYDSMHASRAYAAHLAMDATFAATAVPRAPIKPLFINRVHIPQPLAA